MASDACFPRLSGAPLRAVTIKSGESVTFKNVAGFPHNVVFDEDEVPVSAWLNQAHAAMHRVGSSTYPCSYCEKRNLTSADCLPMSAQSGVDADAISQNDLLNAPGETYTVKLTTAGTYGVYCEPHQGAGMVGKIIVQ